MLKSVTCGPAGTTFSWVSTTWPSSKVQVATSVPSLLPSVTTDAWMVSVPAKVVVGTLMRLSSPTAEPRSTEVMVIASGEVLVSEPVSVVAGGVAVSVGVVAAGVPASVPSSSLSALHADRARVAASAAASVVRGSLRIMGESPWSGSVAVSRRSVGEAQHLPGADQVRIVDLVAVGFEDRVPGAGAAQLALRDLGRRVAGLHGVGAGLAVGGRGVGASLDIGEVAARVAAAHVGEIRRAAAGAQRETVVSGLVGHGGPPAVLDAGSLTWRA